MLDNKSDKMLTTFTSYSGLIILISISLAWNFSRAYYLVLAIVGIWYFLKSKMQLCKDQKIFCLPIILFFVSALLSYLVNDSPKRGPQILIETFTLLLFAIPLLKLYTRYSPSIQFVWGMFIAGAMAIGVYSIIELWITPGGRAGGSTGQAVLFATMAAALTGAVSASYSFLSKYRSLGTIIFILATGLGFTALLLSGSRGAWLAIPFIILFILLFYFEKISWLKKSVLIFFAFIVIPLASYQVTFVSERVNIAVEEVSKVMAKNPNLEQRNTSVGLRVELWRTALDIFSESIIFGVGPGSYKNAMKKYVEENDALPRLPNMKHAHNQLLNTLMTKGLIGAIALIFMLTSHLYVFIKYLKRSNSTDIRTLALAACMIIFTFIILGLTSSPFERKITLVFYAFSLSVLLGKIIFLNKAKSATSQP